MTANVIFHSLMSTHRQTRANAITLTISVLLGLGALAGCSGSSSAPPTATASASGAGSSGAPSAGSSAGSAPGARGLATPAGKSAPVLLHDTVAALRSGGSVHVDITESTSQGSLAYSDDATASGGRQVITIDRTGHVTILFIAGVGYVQANATGLAALFQLPQPQADQFAGQWIALRPGDKLGASTYDDVTAGITLSSVATELKPNGTPTLAAPATVAGQRVVGVQTPLPAGGQLPATARNVLYMTDNSLLRPVLSEVTNAGSYRYQVSFSHWGETLHLTAPANAVPASSVTPASSIT
jgi:hypothetical protein